MNYLDYLKKKKDENDNSQSNTTTGNTSNSNEKSDSLLDAINGKNGNNDYLDYLNSQPVLGQEEEETQALHDMGNDEDVLSRWYDSASNATSKAYYENQMLYFDSLKNRADTISKYYQTADALKGSAKQFYDKYGYTDDSSDMQSAISDLNIAEEDVKTNAKEIQNAMSDFDTEQEYKSAVAQAEEDAKTSDDLQKEYDELKKEYDVESKKSFDKESYSDSEIAEYYNNINAKAEQLDNLQRKIDQKKELENEKKYYTDFRKQNPEVAKTLDAYYDMQSYEEKHSKDAFDTYNKDALKEKLEKGKSPTDSLYTDEEKKAIETNFNSLKTLDGWNVDQIYKYYKRAKDREKAEKENKNIKDFADKHPIASTAISTLNMIPSAFESSPKQVASVVDKWTGGDGYYNPEESAVYQNNLLQQEVASNIDNPFLQGVYQQGVSLVDNAIRMGIAYANPAVGLSMMGAEVATQGFNDTVENGGSVEQALATGLTYAGVEVLTEGVSLGKLKSFKNGGVKEFKSILKNAGKQILTEASEEVSATLLDSVADEIINGSLSQLETEYDKYIDSGMSETEAGQAVMLNYGGQIIQDAIGGALMGGISGTAVNTSQYRRNIKAGKSISSLDNIDTVKNLAKHYGLNDSVTDYESNPTDAKLGALQSEAYEKATESMPSEKEFKRVIKKANLASDEKVVANKLTNGENLTDDDLEKIKKSENLKSLLANDVVNQAKSARFNQQTALLSADTKLFTPSLIEFNAEKSDADANLNNAETLDKFLSENSKNMTINTDTVDKMKDAYNGLEDKIEPDTFAMEYARFFNQGVCAVAFKSLNSTASQLPYNVQVSAYEDGLNKYTTALKAGNALSKLQQEWKDKTNGYAKGTVDNSALEGIELNDEQKATANYISKFADFGLNVKLYASQADENGNFSLKNGAYNSATNTVSIDLNAKRKTVDQALKQGAIIATFGHELTHIAEHAPTEYAELTKAIRDTVGTDIFNATVDKHRSILEDYNSKSWQKMSESEKEISATKEAIAEFCSDLVNQSKILEKMSKENPSAGKKFINAIKNVIAKIKKFITGDRGKTEEARLLESTAKDLQGIVDKYEKAVIEGLKNQNAKTYAKKSSDDAITYDNDGKVIPLSERFDGNEDDIRYNISDDDFLSDDEYNDLFDFDYNEEEGNIDFKKAVDENHPELTIEQIYHHSANNVKEGLLASKGIKPDAKKINNMVKSVMRSYYINPNAEIDSLVTEYVDSLSAVIDSVQNDNSEFNEAFKKFVMKCREALQYSTQLDEQHEAWAKEIRDELKGTTLLIPDNAIDTIKENYGSVGKYRKALFGKINVKLERNAKGINGKAVGSYIEDIGSHLEELGGRSLMIEDGFDWDSDSGYQMLDRIMNYELAPHYVSTYGGNIQSESTIDASAIQMAFDTTAEYFKLQSKQAVTQKNVDKRKLSEVTKALKQAQENQEILRKKIIEEYEAKLAEKNNISIQITAGDFLSTREALAQALETTTINASEQNTVKTYQQGLEQMNELNDKLNEIDSKIKTINAKDNISKSDKAEIASLMKVKAETEEKIVNKDKSLLKLESTEAMRNILKYETSKKIARVREQKNERIDEIRKQETQKRKDAVAKLRKQKNDKIDDIILKNREKRKADAEKRKDNQDWSHSISEIKKYSKKLLDAVLHPTEKMYIPYGLNEPIKSITSTLLDSINLDNDTKMSDNLRKLSQQLEQVNQSDEHYGDFYNAYNEEIIEEIKGFADYLDDRLEGVKIKKQTQGESLIEGLTHEEAKEIEQIVKDVYNATRDAVKQIGRQDAITNYESGLRIINQTRELGDVKLNVMDSLLDQVLSPMRLMAKYTGYNADAELMYHINALNEGTEKYNMFKMLAEKPLNDFIKENPKEYESFKNDVIEIKYRDNKNVAQTAKMTKSQGLQILMSWTREHTEDSHLDHMERGGVTLLDAEQISKGNYEKAFAQRKTVRGINLSFISAVQSQMGEFEKHYRELAETLFNEVSNAYINDTSAILLHRDIATEKYYIPFAVNKDFLSTEIDGLKYDATIVNKGMLKATKRNAPQALNIAGLDSVISKHIRDVGQYYGYAVPIRNLNKALNVKLFDTNENGNKIATDSVRNALRETFNSDKPIQFIEQVMTDLQTSRKSNSQTEKAINKIVRAVRDNMITSALKGSVSVVIKQGASLYTASSILSMRSVSVGAVKGIQQIARKGGWKQLTDEIDAHTAGHYMRRIGLSSMEIEAMKDSWLGKKLPTALNPAKWIQGTDCITTALHWVATKEEVSRLYKEQGKADQIGSDEYFDEVTKLYDQILEETQPMYDSLHRGEIQKNSNELLKSVFMFKTQPLQNTGILYDAIMDYQANKDNAELRGAKKQKLAKAVSSQMVSALTFVAMTFIASLVLHKPERYKDENDEVTLSSVLERLGIDWAETGFSVLVPIGGAELASFIENQINGKDYDFASDNVVSMLNDFTSSIGDFNQNVVVALAQGNFDLDKAKDALWGLSVDGLAFFRGFPLKNYSNIVNGIFSNLSDAISGHSTYFGSSGGRKGSEYANSYDVLIDNNPEKAKQQLETFYNEKYEEQIAKGETTTEAKKKAQTSVRTALTTQYKKEYQKAFLNNDRDTMQKISKKLQESGYMKWEGKSLSTVLGEWTKSAQEDSSK